MTNQELSAAIKDLDQQLEEFVARNRPKATVIEINGRCDKCGWVHGDGVGCPTVEQIFGVSVSNQDGQAGGARYDASASASGSIGRFHRSAESTSEQAAFSATADKSVEYSNRAERGESNSSDSPRITFAEPERHFPTKWLGWLLIGLAAYCAYLLGAAIARMR